MGLEPRDDDFHLEKIHFLDNNYESKTLTFLLQLYVTMLPELASPRHQSGQPVREVVDIDE